MRANGLHAKEIARALGERTGRPSREIYQRVIRDSGEE